MNSISDLQEMKLPFPHGIEIELQVIRKDGAWIRGEDILAIFDKIVSNAKSLLDKKIRSSSVQTVREKYGFSAQTEEGERGSRIVVTYRDPSGEPKEYTLLGHDPNVVSLTWILEVATPPCTTLEELAWWIQTLISISYESLPRDTQAILVATGLNPTQEYLRNLSFGEHHHILGMDIDEKTKIAVYNMIRNFIPHLIALSVNSPFENKKPSDEISIDDEGVVRAPRCKRSIRLYRNTTQMGPTNEFEMIPFVEVPDKEAFARHVNRSYARMVDCYPFTDYGTIEIRVFDTQLSIPRRIGLALILQALALKAKRMIERGEAIPDVGAKSLSANRASAIAAGLWGPFRSGEGSNDFLRVYNHQITDDGLIDEKRRNRFLGEAVISMLYIVREELDELKIIENQFMQALLVSVFGSEYTRPKTTSADFQLEVYAKSDFNMVALLKRLAEVTRECSTNWLYDPIEGTPHLPTWLCWWKGFEPEIVLDTERTFAGQEVEFTILIRNNTGRNLENLTIKYSIEDSQRNPIDSNVIAVDIIESGEIHVSRIVFATRKDSTAYNVIAEIGFVGRQINLTNTINMYWMSATIRPGTTTQFADGKTPVLFKSEIETNYPSKTFVNCQVNVLAPALERIITQTNEMLEIEGGETTVLESAQIQPLLIPPDVAEGVERCVLQIRLFNEDGLEIAEGTSKPFYVGFVRRGPQVLLDADIRKSYIPGDSLFGKIIISDKNKAIGTSARMVVDYLAESGKSIEIENFLYEEFISSEVSFNWRIPQNDVMSQADRVGQIRVRVVERNEVVASIESDRFSIEYVAIRVNIDSLRVPQRSHIGGKISGWLRIRRNTEQGDPAMLSLSFLFPDDEQLVVYRQPVKQSKNLSLSFGPITVPAPKSATTPGSVTLIAVLCYSDVEMDRRSAIISLTGKSGEDFAKIDFVGLPGFVMPDQLIQATIQVESSAEDILDCLLSINLESIAGNQSLIERGISLDYRKPKIVPVSFRVPLGSEMSTGHLKASLKCGVKSHEKTQRFKVKAIEKPFFKVSFSIRNESGDEIPGLVARLSPVDIIAKIDSEREGFENLMLSLRVMSRRDVIKEFEIPLTSEKVNMLTVRWLTPPIDVVTGYYLDASILQSGRPLPNRALEIIVKQFTVY
jgi:hypothetical protein